MPRLSLIRLSREFDCLYYSESLVEETVSEPIIHVPLQNWTDCVPHIWSGPTGFPAPRRLRGARSLLTSTLAETKIYIFRFRISYNYFNNNRSYTLHLVLF
jgi:hypothetical protein